MTKLLSAFTLTIASVAAPPPADPNPARTACLHACTVEFNNKMDRIFNDPNLDGDTKYRLQIIAEMELDACKAACPPYVPPTGENQ